MAQIIMVFGKLEIPYGTYRFSTDAEKTASMNWQLKSAKKESARHL